MLSDVSKQHCVMAGIPTPVSPRLILPPFGSVVFAGASALAFLF